MEILILLIVGYLLCGILAHFAKVVECECSGKLYIYKLAKFACLSWLGVAGIIAGFLVQLLCDIDERIEELLK